MSDDGKITLKVMIDGALKKMIEEEVERAWQSAQSAVVEEAYQRGYLAAYKQVAEVIGWWVAEDELTAEQGVDLLSALTKDAERPISGEGEDDFVEYRHLPREMVAAAHRPSVRLVGDEDGGE